MKTFSLGGRFDYYWSALVVLRVRPRPVASTNYIYKFDLISILSSLGIHDTATHRTFSVLFHWNLISVPDHFPLRVLFLDFTPHQTVLSMLQGSLLVVHWGLYICNARN